LSDEFKKWAGDQADEVERLAAKVVVAEFGAMELGPTEKVGDDYVTQVKQAMTVRLRTIEEAVAEEREACAKVADVTAEAWGESISPAYEAACDIAAAIRARKP
jgi:hypothetical protein